MSLSTHKPVQGNIIAAMAWRVKYRITDEDVVQWVPIMSLGVHAKNRGGPYPAGLRCRALCESSVTAGFNKEELNHAGVVVQERPISAVAADYVSMGAHNKAKSEGDELLQTCFTQGADVRYGTLSHSHMLLVIRAWMTKAKWNIPANTQLQLVFCDKDGCLSLSVVAVHEHGRQLLAVISEGLKVEILSYKMDIEEPTAACCISIALNEAQGVALQTTEQTAVSVLQGLAITEM